MLADDFFGRITLDPLGARVPADDVALRVEHENCVVGDCCYEEKKSSFAFAQLLRACVELPRALLDAVFERLIEHQQAGFERLSVGNFKVRAKKPACLARSISLNLASAG